METKTEIPVKALVISSETKPQPQAPERAMFVHSFLDEYGLDAYEFRVYGHVVRRTGSKPEGIYFASLKKTAKICCMSTRQLQYALKLLCAAKFLDKEERLGRTHIYRLTYPSQWVNANLISPLRASIKGGKGKRATEAVISILDPADNIDSKGVELAVKGIVVIPFSENAQKELSEHKQLIGVYVKDLTTSNNSDWYGQKPFMVLPSGDFECSVCLGSPQYGVGSRYEVRVAIVSQEVAKNWKNGTSAPEAITYSRIIVRRIE